MTFRERRQYKKLVKHLLHDARHARHMREDIADPNVLAALSAAEAKLIAAWEKQSAEELETRADELVNQTRKLFPRRPKARWRENIEILVVALAVAMAFRTYFIQPFKIPTGSMQPTLFGIIVEEQDRRGVMDIFPLSLVNLVLFGERYVEVKAPVSGQIFKRGISDEYEWYEIRTGTGAVQRKIRPGMQLRFEQGQYVAKGSVLASGRVRHGDHIFVDKVRYNFSRPRRGNIFVFSTDNIPHPRIRKNSFYIKRLVGLPGEKIQVDPPYLVVDGKRIEQPYPFERLANDPNYDGYSLISRLAADAIIRDRSDAIQLGKAEYLPFGDNTLHSMDGRFFGGVPEVNIVGPAFAIYWPLSKRWGHVR